MPKIHAPKESIEGKPQLGGGIFEFRLDGFKPKKSKDGKSTNLNPQMRVINHPTNNDAPIFENMNSQAGWVQQDFCHALGVEMEPDGGFPGEFNGPESDPSQWTYMGPLVGRTGRVELVQVPNLKGGMRTTPKKYFCAVPGCTARHTESLAG